MTTVFGCRGATYLLGVLGAIAAPQVPAQCGDLFGSGFEASGGLPAPISGSATLATSDGVVHTWYYRVPTAQAPFRGHPVLIWLHGDGGTGSGHASAFHAFTDADSAIVVTPNGINQTWEHAAGDRPGRPQDSQFISRLLDLLIEDGVVGERVDARRIHLGGDSRGAYMPYFLLQRPSTKSRLASVAVNAGLLYCQTAMPIARQAASVRSITMRRHRYCTCMAAMTSPSHRRHSPASMARSTGASIGAYSTR